jgi:hypothetical protein
LLQLAGIREIDGMQKPEIAGRKSVGFPERSHRDILRGPFSDTGNLAQFAQKCVAVNHSAKLNLAATNRARQSTNRFCSRSRQTYVFEFRLS